MNRSQPTTETASQTCARLVIALNDLVFEEAQCIDSGDIATVLAIQARLEPIVEYLSQHAADADRTVRDRIAAVLQIRERSSAKLETELSQLRQQINELDSRKRTAAAVVPVYGAAARHRGNLNAKG